MSAPGEKIPADAVPVRSRLRRFGDRFCPPGEGGWFRRMRWSRLSLTAAVAGLGLYGAGVAGFYAVVHHYSGIEEVRFADLLLPWRWSRYDVARGHHFVALAQRSVKQRKYREGLIYARKGVGLAPGHREGRLLLVDMLGAARRLDAAREALLAGLGFHLRDPRYVKSVLTFLLQQQEDGHVVELAERYLPALDDRGEAGHLFALGAASACYFRGHYDRAEDFLASVPRLAGSRDGRLLAARIERDRGYPELALLRLRELGAEYPRDVEVHRELAELLRRRGLADEARRHSLTFQIAHPHLAGPRLALLQAYRAAGDAPREWLEVETFLRDFAGDRGALLDLAEFAANAGDRDLVARLRSHAHAGGLPSAPFVFLTIEAAIVAGDYRGALEAIRACGNDEAGFDRRQRAVYDSLRAIAYRGLGDTANSRVFLAAFLAQPDLRAENLLAVANRFSAIDAPEQAWLALEQAVKSDPQNQAALARLIELDITLNRVDELARHVRQFVSMRRPSPEILRVARHKLGSDLFLFSKESAPALAAVQKALNEAPFGGAR